ncbi:hypothetical protein ACQKMV_12850 [Lysinibacillus sp. NPDC094403]|uniref:hypothetical protein n=1 Tax=Lysinibacillus sp. NPDC094403 TaxID=3390581 RepID=UPI003D01D5B8
MNLIDNGLHSYRKAIHNLKILDEKSGVERELIAKDIVLSLHHSIETLFKYIVQDTNKLLIYDNLNDYFSMKMNSMIKKGNKTFNGNTISFMEAVQRAIILNSLEINETDYGSIEHLNKVRNAITHHEYDLTGKQINYLITQVISVVFPIYKKLITDFTYYVNEHDLNLIGSTQVKELNVWKFIRYFSLNKKFTEGKKTIERIKNTPGEFQRKEGKIKKEVYISYHQCPCCSKNFFVKANLVLDDTGEKGYEGNCLMCEISFTKEDSYFLYLISKDYDSFLIMGDSIVSDLLDDEDLSTKITQQELKDIKMLYTQENNGILEFLTNIYLKNKLYLILENYVDTTVREYDNEIMDSGLFGVGIKKSKEIDRISKEDQMILKKIFENFEILELSKEYYNYALNRDYIYNTYRSHPNPHNDNEEEEIEINLTFTFCDMSFLEE